MTMRASGAGSETPGPILASYEAYGCRVNAIDPAELFQRYQQAGFLYPAKLERLEPFLPEIEENWRRGTGEPSIHQIVTYLDSSGAWASISGWRTTHAGWNYQHLVSTGGPPASRAVLLASQAALIRDPGCLAGQNWFQRGNGYAGDVFGSIGASIGPQHASAAEFDYLGVPVGGVRPAATGGVAVVRWNGRQSGLFELAVRTRGRVYALAEELDHDDLLLDAVDKLYSTVGLRRYRRIWLAMLDGYYGPVGAAVAYRGPLGFNFGFLENRCDLLVEPTLTDEQTEAVARALVGAAVEANLDFPPQTMPVVADDRAAPALLSLGGEPIRRYTHGMWLRPGFLAWYRHVERQYPPPDPHPDV
jgi:hypothetical protein